MENSAIAYVIMPYAKEYERVYRNLIKPAVEKCGLTCERTDKDAKSGHILSSVIEALSHAEIVIADISGCNWNVAYELGVRHTFSKKGTVIMCNDATDFPFDISGYDVIQYATDWLDQNLDDAIIDKIVARIETCRSASAKSDSPVHDQFPTLPQSLLQFLNTSDDHEQQQIKQLKMELATLQEQNSSLQSLIEQAGLDAGSAKQKSLSTEQQIIEALENGKYTSDVAVASLRELLEGGKKDEFARFLAKVLDNGYLDEADCKSIYFMCRRLDNPTIVRIFLERAVEFYPDSEELQGFLAAIYSSDYRFREKALSMANAMIGLAKKDGKYELNQKVRSDRMIGSFFNVYLALRMFQEIIDVGTKLLAQSPRHSILIRRNLVKAYRRLEDFAAAEREAMSLIADDPTTALNHYEAFCLHDARDEPFAAYKELEKCIACEEDDSDYYRAIAGHICDERVARTAEGKYIRIASSDKELYAMPFLIRGLSVNLDFYREFVDFLRRNKFTHSLELLNKCSDFNGIMEAFAGLDFTAVDLCAQSDCLNNWESE